MNIIDDIMKGKTFYRPFKSKEEEYKKQDELVLSYRDGNEEAVYELLEMCAPLIASSIKKAKVDDPEELALVCLELFSISLEVYTPMSKEQTMSFSGYLSMRLRFGILDHFNEYIEDRNVYMKSDRFTSGNIVDYIGKDESPVENEVIGSDIVDIDYELYLVLDKMDLKKRRFAELYYIENRGEQEICEELGISQSSFLTYRSQTKRQLKKFYQEVKGDDNTL